MKYETIPVVVEAEQFMLNKLGLSTVFSVGQVECSCDAMDSYTCEQHGDLKKRWYATEHGRGLTVHIGDWVVRYPNGLTTVHSPKAFRVLYREVK